MLHLQIVLLFLSAAATTYRFVDLTLKPYPEGVKITIRPLLSLPFPNGARQTPMLSWLLLPNLNGLQNWIIYGTFRLANMAPQNRKYEHSDCSLAFGQGRNKIATSCPPISEQGIFKGSTVTSSNEAGSQKFNMVAANRIKISLTPVWHRPSWKSDIRWHFVIVGFTFAERLDCENGESRLDLFLTMLTTSDIGTSSQWC